MCRSILALALVASTSAFVAPAASKASSNVVAVAKEEMDGVTMPVGFFDPLGFTTSCSDEALMWYRESELKHGRVAMAAFVGFIVNYNGLYFPADLDLSGAKFSTLGVGSPFAAWDNLSDKGKWSIIGFLGILEALAEAEKPHYTKGGKVGSAKLQWFFGEKYLSGKSEEDKKRARTSELNNGRLAMIGTFGFIAASTVPGSVPLLGDLTPYSGDVFAPF